MTTATTILTRKEIVAVLIELNNKIDRLNAPSSLYEKAQLATFMSLRNSFLHQLLDMNKELPLASKVA